MVMPYPAGFLGIPGQMIKRVQQVSISLSTAQTSNTATITSVNTAYAVCFYNGHTVSGTATNPSEQAVRVDLTNATTVTATRNSASASNSSEVRATVIEFSANLVQSVQQGTIVISAVTSNTATITSVDTTRSVVIFQGFLGNTTGTTLGRASCSLVLTNATTVTATKGNATNSATVGYTVIQFLPDRVKSVQPVSVTSNTTALTLDTTITAVVQNNCICLYNGTWHTYQNWLADERNRLYLTSTTNARFERTAGDTINHNLTGTILEFLPGIIKSRQVGTTALASVSSNTTTVTSVSTAKSLLSFSNAENNVLVSGNINEQLGHVVLTNATTITGTKNSAGTTTLTFAWELIEFF